jgi:hypothetical protein
VKGRFDFDGVGLATIEGVTLLRWNHRVNWLLRHLTDERSVTGRFALKFPVLCIRWFKGAALMIDAFPKASALLSDRGYDANWLRHALIALGIKPCIPSKANRKVKNRTTERSTASATG